MAEHLAVPAHADMAGAEFVLEPTVDALHGGALPVAHILSGQVAGVTACLSLLMQVPFQSSIAARIDIRRCHNSTSMAALRRSLRYLYNGSTGGENVESHFMANDGSSRFRGSTPKIGVHQDPRTDRSGACFGATMAPPWT